MDFSTFPLSSDVYYLSFPKDRVLLKIAVVWVYLVGVTQTGIALVDFFKSAFKTLIQLIYDEPLMAHVYVFFDHLSLSVIALTAAGERYLQSE